MTALEGSGSARRLSGSVGVRDGDLAGNVLAMIDRAGNEIDQAFSDLNQLTGRTITLATGFGGDTDEDFAYDALGRLTQASDDDSIVAFTYDSLGRVLTETQGDNPLGTTGKTVTYTVDAEGNQTEIDYPSGFEAHRTFDELNRLTLLEDASSNDIASWTRYGAANRHDVLSYENGTTTTWGWDGFRRPTTITHEDSGSSEFAGFTYGWDKDDNPTFEARRHQSGKGDVYSYDRANRLIKVLQDVDDPANEVANPGAEAYADKVEYNMDDVLNFTSLVTTPYGGSAATVSYSTNAMNEYTSVGGTTHTYDDNGNLVDDGTYEYVYDAHNHLIEVIDPAGPTTIATYTYDALGLGRRSSKTVGSDTTRFVYANQQCLEEYDGSGNLSRLFAFGQGIDEVAMMEAPDVADVDGDLNTTETKRFYYHAQLLGSVTQVTDPDEVVVESYDYGPYGEITIRDIGGSTVSGSQIGNPFTYTGRRLDEESGLYYYRARHYSSELKRFIQMDPLEYVDGPNSSAYVGNSPGVHVDRSGLTTIKIRDLRQSDGSVKKGKHRPEFDWDPRDPTGQCNHNCARQLDGSNTPHGGAITDHWDPLLDGDPKVIDVLREYWDCEKHGHIWRNDYSVYEACATGDTVTTQSVGWSGTKTVEQGETVADTFSIGASVSGGVSVGASGKAGKAEAGVAGSFGLTWSSSNWSSEAEGQSYYVVKWTETLTTPMCTTEKIRQKCAACSAVRTIDGASWEWTAVETSGYMMLRQVDRDAAGETLPPGVPDPGYPTAIFMRNN